jgi:pSer/pThr/pTyr-binding forkhead associated (FHA) protein
MPHDVAILMLRLGLVAVIYVFLFQLVIVLWRDLRQPAPVSAPVRSQAALEVIDPGASGRATGELITIDTITSIGRSEANAVSISDPAVSTRHALLSFRLGQWWLEDVGSSNGTFLNDVRVVQPVVIQSGDVLRLGGVRLRVQV